jgi:hypothetical protein
LVCGGAWGSKAFAGGPTVQIVNESTAVSKAELDEALPAFQDAVTLDLAPVWGTDATLTTTDTPGAWKITITDDPDVLCFCAGYHDVNKGQPQAKVFAATMNWQLVLTHELFEMLADPWINRAVRANGQWWLVEVADPPEAEAFAYTRQTQSGATITITDFLYPNWYRPGTRGPYDHTRHIRKPLRLLEGGYACYWGTSWRGNTGWQCVTALHEPQGFTWDDRRRTGR